MCRARVQERQRATDQRITQSSEPAGAVDRKLIHMQPDHLDEHQFRKPVEHALAPGAFVARLGGGEADELVEQAV